jgi:hypothetical protein
MYMSQLRGSRSSTLTPWCCFYTHRSAERVQGYFVWAEAVIQGIRGTNIGLEEKLDEVFASEFELNGNKYPALVPESERPAFLEKYYNDMAQVSKDE